MVLGNMVDYLKTLSQHSRLYVFRFAMILVFLNPVHIWHTCECTPTQILTHVQHAHITSWTHFTDIG